MAFEMRDMSGSLFVNQKKQKPSHPDFTGKVMVAGTTYWVSAWKKQAKSGKSFLSLAVREMDGGSDSTSADPFDLDR